MTTERPAWSKGLRKCGTYFDGCVDNPEEILEQHRRDTVTRHWSQRLMTRNKRTGVKDWWQESRELESKIDDKKLESKTDDKKQENWSQRLMTRIKRTGVKDWWQETGVKDWWQETGELESRTDDKKQESWSHWLMSRNRRSGVTDWVTKTREPIDWGHRNKS